VSASELSRLSIFSILLLSTWVLPNFFLWIKLAVSKILTCLATTGFERFSSLASPEMCISFLL
jgi:hypothetical protein